ncbi:MAG: hypothetical protein IKD75_07615 [Prevotella sp.]|nr:hypothetical protein [Prevotella sp.]
MRGRLVDLAFGMNRKQRITIELDEDFRPSYDQFKDTDINLTVKKYRKPRSKDANAYAWVIIDKIAEALSITKVEVYRRAIRDIGGVSEIVCVRDAAIQRLRDGWEHNGIGWQTETMPSKIEGCTNVILYYGSSTYDTKQMSTLIDHLVTDAKALGIETMSPEELASLIGNEL